MFAKCVEFEAIIAVPAGFVVQGDSFKAVVEQLVVPAKMKLSAAACTHNFNNAYKDEGKLKSASTADLAVALLNLSSVNEVSLPPEAFAQCAPQMPTEEFVALMHAIQSVHGVACAFLSVWT